MPRRRLRLSYSSEDDDELQNQQQQADNEAELQKPAVSPHPPNSNLNPNPNDSYVPVEISDDEEFIDVSDNLSPPSPPSDPSETPTSDNHRPPPAAPPSFGGCPINDYLGGLGLRLRREWLDACLGGLERSLPGFVNRDVVGKTKLCFEQFLLSDMNICGAGSLPENVDRLHLVDLPGPYVLQVDEIVNLSCPLKNRYQKAAPGVKRCLKLSMTDGVQHIFGMEYRPIKDLDALAPAGLKVAICNVHVRHGLLVLVPEAFEVLGGFVEELEAARQRLVEEVNKPPGPKRTRAGVLPPLTTRAACAAWPSNGAPVVGQAENSESHIETSLQARDQGTTLVASRDDTGQRTMEEFAASTNEGNAFPSPPIIHFSADAIHMDTTPSGMTHSTSNQNSDAASVVEDIGMDTVPRRGANSAINSSSNDVLNNEDMDLIAELEHPLIPTGVEEIPFTYLASLSARWAAMKQNGHSVRGKIKCFLTGVKGFQYKQRKTYDLRVYVDDGSLISEILIDHNIVQKGIGRSPPEVTAALSSSDLTIVHGMRDTMKQFQYFLTNFEGIIVVEMNKTTPFPVALEMNQGCLNSDAWLLLRRLKSDTSAQTPPRVHCNPIDISP